MTVMDKVSEKEELLRFAKKQIREPAVLNEAYDYETPVPFSRGTRVELPGFSLLLISGTASVDEVGESIHAGRHRGTVLAHLQEHRGLAGH